MIVLEDYFCMFSGNGNICVFNLNIIIATYFGYFIFLSIDQNVSLFIFLDALRVIAL